MLIYAIRNTLSLFTHNTIHSGTFNRHHRSFLLKMHMFPLGRVVYMPLSTSSAPNPATTTLLGPVTPDFSSPQTIPLYNTTLLGHPFNLCTTTKCKFPFSLCSFPFLLMILTGLNIEKLSILHNTPKGALFFTIIMNIDMVLDSCNPLSCCRFGLLEIKIYYK